ncbi:MAG: hypothetical protein QXG39_10420 [Candidatus Aenigmatarchaeota archaeon]
MKLDQKEAQLINLHFGRDARYLFHPAVSIGLFRFPLYVFIPLSNINVDNKLKLAVFYHEMCGHATFTYTHPFGLSMYMATWLVNFLLRNSFMNNRHREELQLCAMDIQRKIDILLESSILVQEGVHSLLLLEHPKAFIETANAMAKVFTINDSDASLLNFINKFHNDVVKRILTQGKTVHSEAHLTVTEAVRKCRSTIADVLGKACCIDFSRFNLMDISADDLRSMMDSQPAYLSPDFRLEQMSEGKKVPSEKSMKTYLAIEDIVLNRKFPKVVRKEIINLVKKSGIDMQRFFTSPFNPPGKAGLSVFMTPYGQFMLIVPYIDREPPYALAKILILEDYARELLSIKNKLISNLHDEDKLFLSAMKFVCDTEFQESKT